MELQKGSGIPIDEAQIHGMVRDVTTTTLVDAFHYYFFDPEKVHKHSYSTYVSREKKTRAVVHFIARLHSMATQERYEYMFHFKQEDSP